MNARRLLCLIGIHDYRGIRRLSDCAVQVGCNRCPGLWVYNRCMGAVVRWGAEVENLYASLRKNGD